MTRALAISGLTLAACLLSGCSATTYTAIITNDSGRTIYAEITQDQVIDDPVTLGTERVSPGESSTLGPYDVHPLNPVNMRIRTSNEMSDLGSVQRLSRGEQRFVIQDDVSSWSGVTIRQVNE